MKLTERERSMVLVLPAVVIVAGYAWWYSYSQRPQLNAARAAYQDAVNKQVSPSQLFQQRAANESAQRRLEQLQAHKQDLDQQAEALAGGLADPGRRLDAVSRLTGLLARHGLQLRDDTQESHGQKPPKALAEAVARVRPDKQELGGHVRCLQLAGTFADVRRAVRELAQQSDAGLFPLALSMAEADPDGDDRSWTLWIWM
jgi:hypothetical protein